MTVLLGVEGLSGSYEHAEVLRDVTLEVGAGELVALLGANGAGKTSLLRALSGTLPRTRGDVRLEGVLLGRTPSWERAARGLAHVPEGRHVFREMTVLENLHVSGLVRRRLPSMLDTVFELFPRLRERADQPAGSMSGGEQQMLAIGRALMCRPKVLCVDELSSGLAPIVTQQLVATLARLPEQGTAVLVVEQSPSVLAGIVERVYLMESGRIVRHGTLDELGGADAIADLYLGVHEVAPPG